MPRSRPSTCSSLWRSPTSSRMAGRSLMPRSGNSSLQRAVVRDAARPSTPARKPRQPAASQRLRRPVRTGVAGFRMGHAAVFQEPPGPGREDGQCHHCPGDDQQTLEQPPQCQQQVDEVARCPCPAWMLAVGRQPHQNVMSGTLNKASPAGRARGHPRAARPTGPVPRSSQPPAREFDHCTTVNTLLMSS
jgi:hypothetical protein